MTNQELKDKLKTLTTVIKTQGEYIRQLQNEQATTGTALNNLRTNVEYYKREISSLKELREEMQQFCHRYNSEAFNKFLDFINSLYTEDNY